MPMVKRLFPLLMMAGIIAVIHMVHIVRLGMSDNPEINIAPYLNPDGMIDIEELMA